MENAQAGGNPAAAQETEREYLVLEHMQFRDTPPPSHVAPFAALRL